MVDFGTKNRPKIGPKRAPKGVENHVRFLVLSRPSKNRFFAQLGRNLAPKMAPSWSQNGTKIGPKRGSKAKSAPEPVLDRFWTDFGPILNRFWVDFGTILGPCLVDFWFILVAFGLLLVTVLHRVAIQTRA